MADEYTTKITIEADTTGAVQTGREYDNLIAKAKQLGKAGKDGAAQAEAGVGRLSKSVGLLRRALTGFGVAGLFTALLNGVGRIASSFRAAEEQAAALAKTQAKLVEGKQIQALAQDYDRLKASVAAAAAEQQRSLELIDIEVANRRKLEAANLAAAKSAELAQLDPNAADYNERKAAIEARYAAQSATMATSNAREDIVLAAQKTEAAAAQKDQEAVAQDAQTAALQRKLGAARTAKANAEVAAVDLNAADKSGVLDALGKTVAQLFTGQWGRLAGATTAEGDKVRQTEAEKAAQAELEIQRLEAELKQSKEAAAAARKEAEDLRKKADAQRGALDAVDVERATAESEGRRNVQVADTSLARKQAQIAKDQATIAAGRPRIAEIQAQIAAANAKGQAAAEATQKEETDVMLAQGRLDVFNQNNAGRGGSAVRQQRSALEAEVERETREASASQVQLKRTLAELANVIKGLNADLRKVQSEVNAATRRQSANQMEAPPND